MRIAEGSIYSAIRDFAPKVPNPASSSSDLHMVINNKGESRIDVINAQLHQVYPNGFPPRRVRS